MRRYETIFILRPSLNEEEINTVIGKTEEIIAAHNGTIIELDRWGMKKLAYQIKKESQGFYVFCDYSATPEAVAEMERRFRIDDAVLRYMTVKTTDVITAEEVEAAVASASDKQAAEEEETEGTPGEDEGSPASTETAKDTAKEESKE